MCISCLHQLAGKQTFCRAILLLHTRGRILHCTKGALISSLLSCFPVNITRSVVGITYMASMDMSGFTSEGHAFSSSHATLARYRLRDIPAHASPTHFTPCPPRGHLRPPSERYGVTGNDCTESMFAVFRFQLLPQYSINMNTPCPNCTV